MEHIAMGAETAPSFNRLLKVPPPSWRRPEIAAKMAAARAGRQFSSTF